jgi:hypothetical protein
MREQKAHFEQFVGEESYFKPKDFDRNSQSWIEGKVNADMDIIREAQ